MKNSGWIPTPPREVFGYETGDSLALGVPLFVGWLVGTYLSSATQVPSAFSCPPYGHNSVEEAGTYLVGKPIPPLRPPPAPPPPDVLRPHDDLPRQSSTFILNRPVSTAPPRSSHLPTRIARLSTPPPPPSSLLIALYVPYRCQNPTTRPQPRHHGAGIQHLSEQQQDLRLQVMQGSPRKP